MTPRILTTLILCMGLAACDSGTAPLDAADGPSLDGSFVEMTEDLSEADKRRAAAGLLLMAFEERDGELTPGDLRNAQDEASILVVPGDDRRGAVMRDVARVAGGRLTGQTAQSLLDYYATESARLEEVARAEEEAREAARAEAAAKANAAKLAAFSERIGQMQARLDGLDGDAAANAEKLAALESVRDAALARRAALAEQGAEMVEGVVQRGRRLNVLTQVIQGGFAVTVKNTTDAPISGPRVAITLDPKTGGADAIASGPLRIYKSEQRSIPIAPGETLDIEYALYRSGVDTTDLPKTVDGFDLSARVVQYQGADGPVSLTLAKEEAAAIKGFDAAAGACREAQGMVEGLRASLPGTIEKLSAITDADALPEIEALPVTRC